VENVSGGTTNGRRTAGDPLRVAVLTSARAPGLERLLERSAGRGAPYRIVAVVASDPESSALPAAESAGVATEVRCPEAFCRRRGADVGDRGAREAFDRRLVDRLHASGAEAVLMCGYLWIATGELLAAFPDRVFNVHDADLTLRDGDGVPLYRGLRSTRDAVFAGEPETRSTVHLATERVDVGPPLLLSRSFPVHPMVTDAREWEAEDLLKAYAYAQREWMMRASWGALLDRTLELEAAGRIRVTGDGRAAVDGAPAPVELDERRAGARPAGSAAVLRAVVGGGRP